MDCSQMTFNDFLDNPGLLLIKQSKKNVLQLLFKILLGLWYFSPVLMYSEKFLSYDLDFLTWFY